MSRTKHIRYLKIIGGIGGGGWYGGRLYIASNKFTQLDDETAFTLDTCLMTCKLIHLRPRAICIYLGDFNKMSISYVIQRSVNIIMMHIIISIKSIKC